MTRRNVRHNMSAWGGAGGGAALARRIAAREEKLQETDEAAVAEEEADEAVLRPEAADEAFWYQWPPATPDGSAHPPRDAAGRTTLVAAVVVLDAGREHVLLAREAGADEWFPPAGPLEDGETPQRAAERLLRAEARGLAGDEAGAAARAVLAGVEHYPTLRKSWTRITLEVQLEVAGQEQKEEDEEAAAAAAWFPLVDVHEGRVPLVNSDFCKLLDGDRPRGAPVRPGPVPGCGFACHLVEVVVVRDGRLALVLDGGRLPRTHVDRGENVGFAASRLVRASLGMVARVEGVLDYVRGPAGRLAGSLATLHATATPDPGFDGEQPPHRWVPLGELAGAGLGPRALASARRALDPSLGGPVPLLQVRLVMEHEQEHASAQ